MRNHSTMPVRRQGNLDKIVAVIAAVPLIAAETGLNAEHIAMTEGWMSTLVLGAIGATLAAAVALPIAERAIARGYKFKAIGIGTFFVLMLAFSFTTSVSRVGGKADGDVAGAKGHNAKITLAREAYDAAQATATDECSRRGPKCRAAEQAVVDARNALAAAPAVKAENPMAARLAAATGLSEATVTLYQPLLFPMALQIGGFFFLAYGFAPETKVEAPILDLMPMPIVTQTEDKAPVNLTVIEKPKRKAKPKALTYQPAITAKLDGRKIRGIKSRVANDEA